jgi:hypothetical protein
MITDTDTDVPVHGVLCNVIRSGIVSIVFWDGLSMKWRNAFNLMPLDREPKQGEWAVWPNLPPLNT